MKRNIALVYQNVRLPFIFEEATAAGIDITLVHAPNIVVPSDLPGVTRTVSLDIYSQQDAAIEVLLDLHRSRPFDAILTLYDPAVSFTARAAAMLGLPGLSEHVALAARDKSCMRTRFKEAGLNYPAFVKIERSEDVAAAEALQFPVVVKPTSGYSSQGVIRINSAKNLRHAINEVNVINQENLIKLSYSGQRKFAGVIVEEFIDGPEYAIESFACGGKVHVLSIGYKGNPKGPYFEEGIYLAPAPLPDAVRSAIIDQVRRAIVALGITDGPTHTELRLRNGTKPHVLEIGARIGGSGISHFIVSQSAGINYARLALDNALAEVDCTHLPLEPRPVAAAGNYIIPLQGHGTLSTLEGLEEIRHYPETKQIIQFLFPGDIVHCYPRFSGYPGFILTRHRTYEEGEKFYRMLDQKIIMRYH